MKIGVTIFGQRRTRKLIALLAAIAVIWLAEAVEALAEAAKPKAASVEVEVMPEYDDPRVLVVSRATLSNDTPLPAKVTFNAPKQDVEINMACELTDPNGMSCKPTEIIDKGDYQEVSFTTQTSRKVMFEYYYKPAGFPATGSKKFTFKFIPSFLNINELHLSIQQPRTAQGFKISPAAAQTVQDDKDKLNFYLYSFSNVADGQAMTFDISYKKDDPATSVAPKGSPEGERSTSGGTTIGKLAPLIAVLAIIGVIVYWMLPESRKKLIPHSAEPSKARANKRAVRASGKPSKKSKAPKDTGIASFCPECGTRAELGDKFCTACGTGLRMG